jgi:uncharacterized coiled-coil protein SlyX
MTLRRWLSRSVPALPAIFLALAWTGASPEDPAPAAGPGECCELAHFSWADHDGDGRLDAFTVKYHLLASMLLNELKEAKLDHERELREMRDQVRGLAARLAAVESSALPAALEPNSR